MWFDRAPYAIEHDSFETYLATMLLFWIQLYHLMSLLLYSTVNCLFVYLFIYCVFFCLRLGTSAYLYMYLALWSVKLLSR